MINGNVKFIMWSVLWLVALSETLIYSLQGADVMIKNNVREEQIGHVTQNCIS